MITVLIGCTKVQEHPTDPPSGEQRDASGVEQIPKAILNNIGTEKNLQFLRVSSSLPGSMALVKTQGSE